MTRKRPYRPYPELNDRSRKLIPWTFVDTILGESPLPGATDKRAKVMHSPHGPEGVGISRHEQLHNRHSPVAPPRVPFNPNIVQAIEDARLNLLAERIGLPTDARDLGEACETRSARADCRGLRSSRLNPLR